MKFTKQKHQFNLNQFSAFLFTTLIVVIINFSSIVYCESSCSNGYFQCSNAECILSNKTCDGIIDCSNGADETFASCLNNICPVNYFHCSYGACIPIEKKCNGLKDCADNSDEFQCKVRESNNSCNVNLTIGALEESLDSAWQIPCLTAGCIQFDQKCDGIIDCPDNSDEIFETCSQFKCPAYLFKCNYGACIDRDLVCNGVADCADFSDELTSGCQWNKSTNICESQFQCASGLCIKQEQVCDGIRHCNDGSDETYKVCNNFTCPRKEFLKCNYGACVESMKVCVSATDCIVDGMFESCDSIRKKIPEFEEFTTTIKPDNTFGPFPSIGGAPEDLNPDIGVIENKARPECFIPLKPLYGNFKASISIDSDSIFVPQWTVLIYSCFENYTLDSENLRICLGNNKWNKHPLPKCVPTCPPLISETLDISCFFKKEEIPCNSSVPDGTIATMQCKDSYEVKNSLVPPNYGATCREGTWDRDPFKCAAVCGTVIPKGKPLVISGYTAYQGEFPWHVGIYTKAYSVPEQICGGTLISARFVISAAHCFWDFQKRCIGNATDYAIAAGKFFRNWTHADDTHAQFRDVLELKTPKRFKAEVSSFANDIAVLILASPLELSALVRPVCVDWKNVVYRRQLKSGVLGFIAGWGVTAEGGYAAEELQAAQLPFVEFDNCISEVPFDFRQFVTSDKICAGYKNGTSICTGDSGGGLTFKRRNYFFLQGIVSVAPIKGDSCDSKKYVAFTSMPSHIDWIVNTVLKRSVK